jgi:hypothetical protein
MVQTETAVSAAPVPTVVRRRTNALRNLQLKLADIEAKLSEEVHKLEYKYSKLFEPIYNQREKIVNGEYEPTEEEAAWNYDTNDDEAETAQAGGSANKKQKTEEDTSIRGVPDFWLRTLQTNTLLSGLIDELDEPILRQLRDIRVRLNETKPGYTIEFHFNENDWFTNRVLSKTFELNTKRNEHNPLSGDVSPLASVTGTKIEWREGKNVIEQLEKLQQRQGGSSSKPTDDEDDDRRSFFGLFDERTETGVNPLVAGQINPEDIGALKEIAELFELDFEVGQVLKDVIVPKAVLYFTGELTEEGDEFGGDFGEDDDEDEDDEDDEDDDDDDVDDDDEEEEAPQPKKKRGGK